MSGRDDKDQLNTSNVDAPPAEVTGEVGSEGGSFGNVETGIDEGAGTGSEGTETWRPGEKTVNAVVRDETGQGRRNP